MRIITFKCDICKYEKTLNVSTGMAVPRVLWTYGKFELCDLCSERAVKLLEKESKRLNELEESYG